MHASVASNHRRRSVLVSFVNYLAAVKSLVEHSREFIRDGYKLNYYKSLNGSSACTMIPPIHHRLTEPFSATSATFGRKAGWPTCI